MEYICLIRKPKILYDQIVKQLKIYAPHDFDTIIDPSFQKENPYSFLHAQLDQFVSLLKYQVGKCLEEPKQDTNSSMSELDSLIIFYFQMLWINKNYEKILKKIAILKAAYESPFHIFPNILKACVLFKLGQRSRFNKNFSKIELKLGKITNPGLKNRLFELYKKFTVLIDNENPNFDAVIFDFQTSNEINTAESIIDKQSEIHNTIITTSLSNGLTKEEKIEKLKEEVFLSQQHCSVVDNEIKCEMLRCNDSELLVSLCKRFLQKLEKKHSFFSDEVNKVIQNMDTELFSSTINVLSPGGFSNPITVTNFIESVIVEMQGSSTINTEMIEPVD